MINLLNPSDKRRLKAARRNTVWLRYSLLLVTCSVAMNAVFGITAWYIQGLENSYKQSLNENEGRRDSSYRDTKQRAAAFRQNLATAKTILSGETNYSSVIIAIASATPKNCVLDNLSLNNQLFGTPRMFSFRCKNQDDAVRLKTALQQTSSLFSEVSLVSTSQSSSAEAGAYPAAITISATIIKPAVPGEPS